MRHLCVINPMAGLLDGHIDDLVYEINDFFSRNPDMEHDIHVTRWKRDASGYVMRYVKNTPEIVRVYAFGGSGTLFEVINGVIGLPNVEVAYFPLGRSNNLLLAFKKEAAADFKSMMNLSLSRTIAVDTILAGNHYAISGVIIGTDFIPSQLGKTLSRRFRLPARAAYNIAKLYYAFTKSSVQHYRLEVDKRVMEGDFTGICAANTSGNSAVFPFPEARFNDGCIDLYTISKIPVRMLLRVVLDLQNGHYAKWPQYVEHYRCKRLRVTSSRDMTITLDGEFFYDRKLNLQVYPSSLNLVCPPDAAASIVRQRADETDFEKIDLPEEIAVSDFFTKEGIQ